ncbi:MAG: fatty acid oxidation complex subunit alpha FadB [Bacteriovoracaceae bacterium]|jgi:3-hydroxyacyl-CoA dehydrogenase/enoyl-CoA hydratase/3-hydroxybutyryl-CoA epimerase/enoyl-CoA isomerase|nr:fatty acid oxidation complex subunit alpha FadB [Bacteriovoracaceae bacterium]
MLFDGKAISLTNQDNILHMTFDIKDASANVIGATMMEDLKSVLEVVKSQKADGLIMKSNKPHFIFGADITEFLQHFKKTNEELENWLLEMNTILNGFEDLPFPTVSLINGFALGGGLEVCLTTDYRICESKAKIGLPETKLGIMPGWGGTVRLPRITGADHAIEWITSGKQYKADAALKIGAIDAVVEMDDLLEAGISTIKKCANGELNFQAKREVKNSPLTLSQIEAAMTFETAKGFVAGVAGPNYPAPVSAIKVMQQSAGMNRDEALKVEAKTFAKLAKTEVAQNLVSVFLSDQYLKKVSKKYAKGADKVQMSAVLGAGIMGGGIAYQTASKGTPILMKDINNEALELGMTEASKLLGKLEKRGRINAAKMAKTISMITPTLSYGDFNNVDMVVEAVVENIKIKKSVLAELEDKVSEDTIIASNTSTIDISDLAADLKRPENFCGMHFFNPVHRMPLVEIIRGKNTSEKAISKTVQYALQMGKTPIVVNDCPGFLVNRVLFPYFNGFNLLIEDGVDYKRIDKVMEKFGWPMGPAYLMDVVGIDTGEHAATIIGNAFPDRMKLGRDTIVEVMHKENRLGQKNGIGFYKYELDRKGKLKKTISEDVDAIISKVVKRNIEITDEQIIERMMLPMIFECARCLEEKIVETPIEVDMGLLLGLGFPPFRSGALKYADSVGLQNIVDISAKYSELGAMYRPTENFVQMASNNETFHRRA